MQNCHLKAVIFDLDGILCDTSVYHGKAWADLVRGLGHEPPEDLEERVKGISRLASLKIALGDAANGYTEEDLERYASQKNEYYRKAITHIGPEDLYPGALALFDDLKRAEIKIVLGSASKNSKTVLERLEILDRFDAIADGYSYKHGKPHPDVFLKGAGMVGARPEECIVMEDATAGINAALDGAFVTIGMGRRESLAHAHALIESLEEINAETLITLHAQYRSNCWSVTREGINLENEGSLGTLFCVGNGHIGIRGGLPEMGLDPMQAIFQSGFFDVIEKPPQRPEEWIPFKAYWGMPELARDTQIEACLIVCPDFLDMKWIIEGEQIDFTRGELKSLSRRIDFFQGIYTAEAHWVSPQGRELILTQRRFADMAHPDRVYAQYALEPLNFSGALRICAGIDGTTEYVHPNTWLSDFFPQRQYEVVRVSPVGEHSVAVLVKGRARGMKGAFSTCIRLCDRPDAKYEVAPRKDSIDICAETEMKQHHLLYVERVCAYAHSGRCADPWTDSIEALNEASSLSFGDARIAHGAKWKNLWERSDVRIEGDDDDQRGIRFSIFHMLISGTADDPTVSIGAKGLSGAGYRGMVFWDTDIHMTPFFIYTQPEMARNLAMFRYLTLDGAREKAAKYGYKGANYPWETGISGKEECEKWLRLLTHQSHITSDVVYALQMYVDVTGDREFYEDCAAEVFIETARFWMSKAVELDGALSIPDAGGPDEYHVVSNDSAYINNMAIFNLQVAEQAVRHLRERSPQKLDALIKRNGVSEEELHEFTVAADRIRTMKRENGLFEQCRGFFQLRDEIDPNKGGEEPHKTQCVKQADVLMLFYLFPDKWDKETLRKNWDYYEPRTIHASSLSAAVHGILASELGMTEKTDSYIRRSLAMDLKDEMNNTALGAHMAANGMNWTSVVRAYGGARPQGDRFLIEPRLPKGWTRLEFGLKWKGADFRVTVEPGQVKVHNKSTSPSALPVLLCGAIHTIPPGETALRERLS